MARWIQACAIGLLPASAAAGDPVLVGAASSLTDVLEAVGRRYEESTGAPRPELA